MQELNEAIWKRLGILNNAPFQKREGTPTIDKEPKTLKKFSPFNGLQTLWTATRDSFALVTAPFTFNLIFNFV